MFTAKCPHCGNAALTPDPYLNHQVKCAQCGQDYVAENVEVASASNARLPKLAKKSESGEKGCVPAGLFCLATFTLLGWLFWKESQQDKADREKEEKMAALEQKWAEEDRQEARDRRLSSGSAASSTGFELSESARRGIIQTMLAYGARDAAVTPKDGGRTVNLAIEVGFGTSKDEARKMCDNFLRQVMSLSNDNTPGKEIGPSRFDYNVGAFTPDEKWLVRGAKVRGARRLTW